MTLPPLTRTQLDPLIARILGEVEDEAPIILIRGCLGDAPESVRVSDRTVSVRTSSSPLQIRSWASQTRSAPLAVITGCHNSDLGEDLVARSARRKVHTVDRWEIAAELFGAEHVTRALAEHTAVADALIDARPDHGYPKVTSKILDLDTALDELAGSLLGLRAETLDEMIEWAETPQATRAVREADAAVVAPIEKRMSGRFGPAVSVVFAALRTGSAADLTSCALACDVIHDIEQPVADAAIRLEVRFSGPRLPDEAFRQLAAAAIDRVHTKRHSAARLKRWLTTADELLEELGALEHAWRSDVLPSGYRQRRARAAEAIDAWRAAPDETGAEAAVEERLRHARQHLEATRTPDRVERLEMAARLVRRASAAVTDPGTLTEAVDAYIGDGAWFDLARTLVSQSDPEPAVSSLCDVLTVQADEAAHKRAESNARLLSAAAHQLHGDNIGVEHILDSVVAPVADESPTLLVVLDGMGWPSFLDILAQIEQDGWQALRPAGMTQAVAALAVLPTVTELSRTSLLCGTVRSGDKDSEQRAFCSHEALVGVSSKQRPPRLFHKTDLRQGGLDTVHREVLDAVGDPANSVVGVVLNNVDEHLKDVAPPSGGWRLGDLAPLQDMLDAARSCGRAVVFTADHGHVLERGSVYRPGGGGERWRSTDTGPVGEDEIEVRGPRVLTPDGAAILPWAEKLRYGPHRNGYHGGITASEVIVPVVVLSADAPDGWTPTAVRPPAWWDPTAAAAESAPKLRPSSSRPRREAEPREPTLFDVAAIHGATADAINRIMESAQVSGQMSRLRLDDQPVAEILRMLDSAGTFVGEYRVAAHVGVPPMRMNRLVSQMQRLLNIDGYPVIESRAGEVRFDRKLLETQLGIA